MRGIRCKTFHRPGNFNGRDEVMREQCLPHCITNCLENLLLLREPDLFFCRVDVHIYKAGIDY